MGVMAEIQLGKVREAVALAEHSKQTTTLCCTIFFIGAAEEPGRKPDLARALISSFLASEAVRKIIERNMQEGRRMIARGCGRRPEGGEIDPRLKKEKVAIQVLQAFMEPSCWRSIGPALDIWIEDSFQTLLERDSRLRSRAKPWKQKFRIALIFGDWPGRRHDRCGAAADALSTHAAGCNPESAPGQLSALWRRHKS